jgi:hypothetical protein
VFADRAANGAGGIEGAEETLKCAGGDHATVGDANAGASKFSEAGAFAADGGAVVDADFCEAAYEI